nr:hypothetical protein [Haladaptatus sp. R4]
MPDVTRDGVDIPDTVAGDEVANHLKDGMKVALVPDFEDTVVSSCRFHQIDGIPYVGRHRFFQ